MGIPVNYKGEEKAESNTCEGERAGQDWAGRVSDSSTVLRTFWGGHWGVLGPKPPLRGVGHHVH